MLRVGGRAGNDGKRESASVSPSPQPPPSEAGEDLLAKVTFSVCNLQLCELSAWQSGQPLVE